MATLKLTKRSADSAEIRKAEYFLWDSELKGFGLRVRPSGRRFYLVQYRFKGRLRRFVLGEHGKLTAEQARKKAFDALNAVLHDEDPAEARDIDRNAVTLKEFIEQVYLPDCDRALVTYRGRPKKASTIAVDHGRIVRHIIPLLGHRKVRDLTRKDFSRFLEDVASGKTKADIKTKHRGRAIVEGGPGAARRTAGLLSGILSYAVVKHVIDANPALGADRRFADKRRERALSAEEYEALGKAFRAAAIEMEERAARHAGRTGQPLRRGYHSGLAAIEFLALTGFRKSEALMLRRSDVDADKRIAHLVDTKTGEQWRPIGSSAAYVVAGVGHGPGDFLFWGSQEDKPLVGLPKVAAGVFEKAGLLDVSLHTLRHSFASVAAELGYNEFTIAGLLGHRAGSVTARYTHLPDNALKTAAEDISRTICARLNGEAIGGRVVQLVRK